VAKTTIYRWWPSKPALVVAAAEDLAAHVRRPDTGTVRGDLIALLRDVIKVYTTTVAGRLIPGLIADMAEHPDLAEAIGRFWAARREIMLDVLKRGISRGELRRGIDVELAADLLFGPIYYRFLVTRAPLRPSFADRVVVAVLRGKATGPK
jgi:AcrR family transcriptional regulator